MENLQYYKRYNAHGAIPIKTEPFRHILFASYTWEEANIDAASVPDPRWPDGHRHTRGVYSEMAF